LVYSKGFFRGLSTILIVFHVSASFALTQEAFSQTAQRSQKEASSPKSQKNDSGVFQFEYPELVVTPLASERLRLEARRSDSSFFGFWPIWLSSGATLLAGLSVNNVEEGFDSEESDRNKNARQLGAAIALGWVGFTTYLSLNYEPYGSGQGKVSGMPSETKRQKLFKERLSEEELKSAAYQAKWLRYGSALSLLVSNALFLSSIPDEPDPNFGELDEAAVTRAESLSALGAVSSIASLFFPLKWERIWSEQKDYKKKIYGPVVYWKPSSHEPELLITWRF
jgi:hypothetical protein